MAKFKTDIETDRAKDEMRNIEVEIDFTPNALASILYRQGNTHILCCVTKEARLLDGSLVMLPKAGFMQNTHYYLDLRTQDSGENAAVLRVELRRLKDSLLAH